MKEHYLKLLSYELFSWFRPVFCKASMKIVLQFAFQLFGGVGQAADEQRVECAALTMSAGDVVGVLVPPGADGLCLCIIRKCTDRKHRRKK